MRFIIVTLYSGMRKDAALRMGFAPNTVGGWFDLDRGIMYRIGDGERKTDKRRTPAPIPGQLLAHLRRWRASGARWAVEMDGARVGDIKRSFDSAATLACLSDVPATRLNTTRSLGRCKTARRSGMWRGSLRPARKRLKRQRASQPSISALG